MRRWLPGLIVLLALVLAVLLVRPGSQVPEDVLVVPSPGPTGGDPSIDAAVVGPSDLSPRLMIADIATSHLGVGPLVLGQRQGDLAGAGWMFRYGHEGCVRLVPTTVGEVAFSGWVVDGLLVSAQVEMTTLLGRTSPSTLGFVFGRPLEEARDFRHETLALGPAGPGGLVEVGIGTRAADGADVVVSDLGEYGVRFAEVRRAGAPDCQLDLGGLGETLTPTATATALDFVTGLTEEQVGPDAAVVGVGVDALRAPASPWAASIAALSSTGCERLGSTTPAGTTELFLLDGVVVGQRYLAPGDVEWRAAPDVWSAEEGTIRHRGRHEYGRSGGTPPGTSESSIVTGAYLYAAELVTLLDTAAVVAAPLLLEETSGEVCSPS